MISPNYLDRLANIDVSDVFYTELQTFEDFRVGIIAPNVDLILLDNPLSIRPLDGPLSEQLEQATSAVSVVR